MKNIAGKMSCPANQNIPHARQISDIRNGEQDFSISESMWELARQPMKDTMIDWLVSAQEAVPALTAPPRAFP
jgi:hypothetical protein